VALLTILLMVVTATILAVGLLSRQDRMLRETSVLLRQDQGLQYALAGENLLSTLLAADAKNNPNTTGFKDVWAQPTPPYPIEDGAITGKLIDQSGKFNVNNLYHDGQVDQTSMAYFKRLLTQVGLSSGLANAVLDWQDPDDTPTDADGAESSFYLGQDPSYLAANRPFVDVAELRKVRGFDAKSFQLIAPYVTALPTYAPININTASMPVMAALDASLTPSAVNAWVTKRNGGSQSIAQVSELWEDSGFKAVSTDNQAKVATLLDVKSSYFQAIIDANLSGRDRFLTSEIFRSGQKVYVWRRSLAPIPLELFQQQAPAS
jgi:general secretion pathway protein K